jgi:L-serine dehydratase
MSISVFDLFSIGVGSSSSHTIGPMRAAKKFLADQDVTIIANIKIELFGSLALTGKAHGTVWSIILGLQGDDPATTNPEDVNTIYKTGKISLLGQQKMLFNEEENFVFHFSEQLPGHSNAMRFVSYDEKKKVLSEKTYYSVGGGFIEEEGFTEKRVKVPYTFSSAKELLKLCSQYDMSISEIVLNNEKTWRKEEDIREGLLNIWKEMRSSIKRGCNASGKLPGILKLPRRAPELYRQCIEDKENTDVFDWLSLYALAVGEENAAGGHLVTAPTNGAAGILPAVLGYYLDQTDYDDEEAIITFLLVAGAIGILYKMGASISGAEVGCQGEVGVACSMAAAGLVAVWGGTNKQIENAAEIGMEHNLGLTCDPVAGLVQIPCIERNAMGAVKAVNAARLAFRGDGEHKISLDSVIATMRQTGADMCSIYKETSQGGLAVNVPEC